MSTTDTVTSIAVSSRYPAISRAGASSKRMPTATNSPSITMWMAR